MSMALQTIKSLEARNGALVKKVSELEEELKDCRAGAKKEEFESKSEQRRMRIQKGEED